ncbi:MAG: M20/M25/M40 family metallo-hydrolase, partial [Planctomycetaceae bacterium]
VKQAEAKNAAGLEELKKKLAAATDRLETVRKMLREADPDELMEFGYGGNSPARELPCLHISQDTCNQLLKASLGKTLAELETAIDESLEPQSAELKGWSAVGEVNVKPITAEVKNVIGVLEGTGPLADETIIVGAHYDHVGLGGEGSLAPGSKEVHNGADDNASGVAALIELARRLATRRERLPRRVVFIAFTAEEVGLIGSARYVKEPVFPIETTIAMFNMDMVGRLRDDKLTVFGSGTTPRWEPWLRQQAEERDFDLTLKPEGFGPSDHSSFYGKRIPVLHFFTGTHSDYHRPGDDWEKVNIQGMTRIIDLIEQLLVETAQEPKPPEYVAIKQRAQFDRGGSRPYFGSIPDFGTETAGYAISGVAPGSPAAQAGLKGGDVIVQLGEYKIGGLNDFDLALRKFSPGEPVKVAVQRGGQEQEFTVILAQPR